ncbi:uncharacterized protein IWZ02DRAFT_141933 [Phyllosticta citriasiana]|uniref:uncharacterized protein n=1 Tax=Phyllosticta citriasiana TaxID=595635 RepID=UPI0030FDA414
MYSTSRSLQQHRQQSLQVPARSPSRPGHHCRSIRNENFRTNSDDNDDSSPANSQERSNRWPQRPSPSPRVCRVSSSMSVRPSVRPSRPSAARRRLGAVHQTPSSSTTAPRKLLFIPISCLKCASAAPHSRRGCALLRSARSSSAGAACTATATPYPCAPLPHPYCASLPHRDTTQCNAAAPGCHHPASASHDERASLRNPHICHVRSRRENPRQAKISHPSTVAPLLMLARIASAA